jgi:hypothetical protein
MALQKKKSKGRVTVIKKPEIISLSPTEVKPHQLFALLNLTASDIIKDNYVRRRTQSRFPVISIYQGAYCYLSDAPHIQAAAEAGFEKMDFHNLGELTDLELMMTAFEDVSDRRIEGAERIFSVLNEVHKFIKINPDGRKLYDLLKGSKLKEKLAYCIGYKSTQSQKYFVIGTEKPELLQRIDNDPDYSVESAYQEVISSRDHRPKIPAEHWDFIIGKVNEIRKQYAENKSVEEPFMIDPYNTDPISLQVTYEPEMPYKVMPITIRLSVRWQQEAADAEKWGELVDEATLQRDKHGHLIRNPLPIP